MCALIPICTMHVTKTTGLFNGSFLVTCDCFRLDQRYKIFYLKTLYAVVCLEYT